MRHSPASHSQRRVASSQVKAASQSGSASNIAASSQSADKENAPPVSLQLANSDGDENPCPLPPQILSLISSITQTLTTYFSLYPPHTIQRLSELILAPKDHYRSLLSYLHAVDRVVHVTSGANVYPLPAATQGLKALPNGTNSVADPNSISWGSNTHTVPSLGSDESLGGALLTPIPWLRPQSQLAINNGNTNNHLKDLTGEVKTESTETIDGPNGAGSIETVSISVNGIPSATLSSKVNKDDCGGLRAEGGVTQGELLRQEQRAGVIPAIQLTNSRTFEDAGVKSGEDETPHARGPGEIGIEDMGPQAAGAVGIVVHGINVEAAVGRTADEYDIQNDFASVPLTPKRGAAEELGSESKRMKDEPSIETEPQAEAEIKALIDVENKETEIKVGETGGNTELVSIDIDDTNTV